MPPSAHAARASHDPQPSRRVADSLAMSVPQELARELAQVLRSGTALLDNMTDRTGDPAWSEIASELDRLAVRLLEIAAGNASTRVTWNLSRRPN